MSEWKNHAPAHEPCARGRTRVKTYLVGGAVRDELLGYPVSERDWVVVGASPQELVDAGFRQVGKDFPVFLHPQTKEEYALARTERKSGRGYTGFAVHCAPEVTLEEDLLRRDLTVNAMARDAEGTIIDPYGGQSDLAARRLRHVSEAFVEDPLRVLRTARFAARYAHLGFRVAEETLALMRPNRRARASWHTCQPSGYGSRWSAPWAREVPEAFIQVLRSCGALGRAVAGACGAFRHPPERRLSPGD